MRLRTVLAGLAGVTLALNALSPARAQFDVSVVMSGLNNPRGLAFGPDGGLYVAEAGSGGSGASIVGGDGSTVSFGTTGAVSRLLGGVQSRVLSNLPSLANQNPPAPNPPGGGSTGLHDIVFTAGGQAFGVIGLGANPSQRANLGAAGDNFGRVVQLTLDGSNNFTLGADIAGFEAANNPDGSATPDSNPYSIANALGGTGFVVADAGANALFGVDGNTVTTIATFPAQPNPLFGTVGGPFYQAVPTTVVAGSDGAYYVGQLTGFPFIPGAANVFRVVPGQSPTILPGGGFTNLIDLAFGPDGQLYTLELTSNGLASQTGPGPGRLSRVNPITGARQVLLSDPLFFPGGLTFGPNGTLYVTNLSVAPGGGQVLALVASPEPGTLGLLALAIVPGVSLLRRRRR